jgi:hypothetical protein
MAQSALTVTPPNPTPPTNFATTGATGPNPPNFTRGNYANMANMSAVAADGSGGRPVQTIPGVGVNQSPPPYYDDGAALTATAFAASVAALAGGTSAADNNTGTTPGTNAAGAGGDGFNSVLGSYPGVASGLVPAAASATAEGLGTETVVTASYSAAIYAPIPLVTVGAGPALVKATTDAGAPVSPNANHASSLSPATNPTLTSVSAGGASGGGTATCTATGTGFTRQSVLNINGINYPTTFVSATSLTAVAPKKATSGNLPVVVITGGSVVTAPQNWVFT